MLGKLIKHEWKATYKICLSLLLVIVVMTALGCVSFYTPMWTNAFSGRSMERVTPLDLVGLMTLLFYILTIVGVMWGIMIYLGVHFYKSMYSDEGYLTHTLPVTSHQILSSRILVNGLWSAAVIVLFLISITVLLYTMVNIAYMSSEGGGKSLMTFLLNNQDNFQKAMVSIFGTHYVRNFLVYLAMMLFGSFCSVTIMFGAVTIGQLFSKHRVMMAIVSYFVINMITQIIAAIVVLPFSVSNALKMTDPYQGMMFNYNNTLLVTTLVNLVLAAVFYFISNYIIAKKLNLD